VLVRFKTIKLQNFLTMKQHHLYLLGAMLMLSSACRREIDPIERASLQAVTTTTAATSIFLPASTAFTLLHRAT
jgi:hypothetical protein